MNLIDSYHKDVKEFEKKYSTPVDQNQWADPLVPYSLELAFNLFPNVKTDRAPDGSALLALDDDEHLLALICLPSRKLEAFATYHGKTYFVAINYGLIRFLFNLSLSIWRNRLFLSYIEDSIRDLTVLGTELVPLGFEEVFLDSTLDISDQIRQTVFYRCFKEAVTFLWLHEIAHVLGGHVDICRKSRIGIIDEFLSAAEPDDESYEIVTNKIPYHAFEIQADRWALDKIFRRLHQQIMSDSAGKIELIYTTVACTLFSLSLHGYNVLQRKFDYARRHPPLWFRADDVFYAEDKAANDLWFSVRRGEKKFEMIRDQQRWLLDRGLAGLSQLHPVFGDWLSPVAEFSRKAEAQLVLDEANEIFNPWHNECSRYFHSFKKIGG